jgi:membrane-bound lytic murein transglycosylase D
MERFFIVFLTLLIAYGCSNFNIIPARPYVDIEPSKEVLVTEVKYNNIWDRIFKENNFIDDPLPNETEKYVTRFLKNKKHFNDLILNGEYYLFEVLEELDRYRLPSEFALLPYIESNYDPFSISSSGAVGLWQLMPTTGKIYNLEKTWWVEERHDPIESTKAAVKYLAYLYNRFDRNPTLTLIAYNAGPTYLEKQIRILESRGREVTLKNLKLSRESFNYVPKFLAINKIVKNPYRYGVNLPILPNKKVIDKIQFEGQVEMLPFSEFTGITPEFLYQLNAGYTKWATPPINNTVLFLPIERLNAIEGDIDDYFQENPIRWMTHNVSSGETLWDIAKLYDVAVDDLKLVNSKSDHSLLSINETLLVPLGDPEITTFIPYQTHIVGEGDTLWSLGRKYNIAPIEIARNNQLSINGVLSIGVALNIGTGNIARSMQAKKRSILYSVKQGDNLYKISELFNIEISEIMELNNLSSNDLSPGQILKLIISAI